MVRKQKKGMKIKCYYCGEITERTYKVDRRGFQCPHCHITDKTEAFEL